MLIKALHPEFVMPSRSTELAAGYDIYMPEDGYLVPNKERGTAIPLGFSSAVPEGYAAFILPRSGAGANKGISLNNTVGVIDADYRGEWVANLRLRDGIPTQWEKGDRILQFVLVKVGTPELELVTALPSTERGSGGFGHTGK
jgi:dUTP pyrophosphatase